MFFFKPNRVISIRPHSEKSLAPLSVRRYKFKRLTQTVQRIRSAKSPSNSLQNSLSTSDKTTGLESWKAAWGKSYHVRNRVRKEETTKQKRKQTSGSWTLVSINVYLTQAARPPPPALHRWAGVQPNSPRGCGEARGCSQQPCPLRNEGGWVQDEGRRGIRGPSPSYLGSEPSAGNSMAGGAGTASAPSPSAWRSRVPELSPSISRSARAATQPARHLAQHRLALHQRRPPPDAESSPSQGGRPAPAARAPPAGAGPIAGSALSRSLEERTGRSGAGTLVGSSSRGGR